MKFAGSASSPLIIERLKGPLPPLMYLLFIAAPTPLSILIIPIAVLFEVTVIVPLFSIFPALSIFIIPFAAP